MTMASTALQALVSKVLRCADVRFVETVEESRDSRSVIPMEPKEQFLMAPVTSNLADLHAGMELSRSTGDDKRGRLPVFYVPMNTYGVGPSLWPYCFLTAASPSIAYRL